MDHKEFAIKIAKKAGNIIKQNFSMSMEKDWKDNDTPVTKTDQEINQLVLDECLMYFPDYGVLAEEGSRLKNDAEFLWVCDPVDGTIPFSHGIPTCVFSLALVQNGKPILGVIYDPFMDRMFTAELGKGAFLNGQSTRVSQKNLDNAVLNWESAKLMTQLVEKYPKILPVKLCSFIYGGMLVATGELVASMYSWFYAHDCASLKIIIEEAGGKTSDLLGQDQLYDGKVRGMLVSNGVVHEQLLEITKMHKKFAIDKNGEFDF